MFDLSQLDLANQAVVRHPLFALLLTFICFKCGVLIYKKFGNIPLLYPLLIAVVLLVVALDMLGLSYQVYFKNTQILHWLLGTVTVALAIPIYESIKRLPNFIVPAFLTVLCSSFVAVVSVVFLARLIGLDEIMVKSLATKSVTTPVAIMLGEQIGSRVELAILFVLITGLLGPLFVPILRKLFPAKNDAVLGVAIGTSSHAIGTAKALEISRECGAFSAFSMSLMGLLTALFLPWLL